MSKSRIPANNGAVKAPEPAAPQPTNPSFMACPACGTSDDLACLAPTGRIAVTEQGPRFVADGVRLGCQRCARVFNVNQFGIYDPHASALPEMPAVTP